MKATCKKCGLIWYGEKQCHCTSCCRHFSTVAVFDAHRPAKQGWKCEDPPGNKYHQDSRGVWRRSRRSENSDAVTPRNAEEPESALLEGVYGKNEAASVRI